MDFTDMILELAAKFEEMKLEAKKLSDTIFDVDFDISEVDFSKGKSLKLTNDNEGLSDGLSILADNIRFLDVFSMLNYSINGSVQRLQESGEKMLHLQTLFGEYGEDVERIFIEGYRPQENEVSDWLYFLECYNAFEHEEVSLLLQALDDSSDDADPSDGDSNLQNLWVDLRRVSEVWSFNKSTKRACKEPRSCVCSEAEALKNSELSRTFGSNVGANGTLSNEKDFLMSKKEHLGFGIAWITLDMICLAKSFSVNSYLGVVLFSGMLGWHAHRTFLSKNNKED